LFGFAVCVSTFQTGFSLPTLAIQVLEIAIFVPFILFGVSRCGAWLLKKTEDDEGAYFLIMLAILAVSGLIAESINLPVIVGSFLAGLAVNAAVQNKPVKEKLDFFGRSLFIPLFFVGIGFLIDPPLFLSTIVFNLPLVIGIILALLAGKAIAAGIAGRRFNYTPAARKTVWSLTLPQVAATLDAALVGYDTLNGAGERLLDAKMLNAVLVLMLTTSILGPVLTERFGKRLLPEVVVSRAEPDGSTLPPSLVALNR
jgi:Kef-type K+ transport system membrane component KefB